ncbi:MAG: ABC transporter ATP-binding protein/permease [Acidimicrobiia bacterium]|nr:ABC transporter ATP-binding protein/permease [Acidimicrobiia bacterium]
MSDIATRNALRRVFGIAPALVKGIWLTLGLFTVGTTMQIIVPVVVQQVIDFELLDPDGVDVEGVLWRGGIALIAVLVAAIAAKVAFVRLAIAAATGLSDLRVATFRHLHRLSMLHVQGERRGALVARVTSDIATIQDFMEWGGVGLVIGISQVLLAVGVMVFYRWQLALLVVLGVMIYVVLVAWFQRILSRAHDKVRLRVADALAAMGEAISGLEAVRAFGAEEATLAKVEKTLDDQFDEEFRTGRLGAFLFSSAEVFAGAITASVVAVGAWLGAAEGVTAGTLVAFLFLVNLLVDPVQLLVETLDQAQTAGAGIRRILDVLDTEVDVPDPVGGVDLHTGRLEVDFEDVRFRYPTGEDALSGVDVHIDAGARVAVVGETGSGKTTFAKLVTRLLDPAAGRVRIGGIGVDEVRFSSLRQRVAFVPQEGFLFDTTVANNVRYGKLEATDAEILEAFEDLGLGDWVQGLPNGLDTEVGERGGNVSAGERQLVALTRAWITDPDLLVLDEATSAVDPALEVQLRRAIERLTGGRTSITVAHRLSTAEASDEILVFDAGRLVERGDHGALVGAGGVYAALHADWASSTTT